MANRTVKPGRNAFKDFDDDEFMTWFRLAKCAGHLPIY